MGPTLAASLADEAQQLFVCECAELTRPSMGSEATGGSAGASNMARVKCGSFSCGELLGLP